MTDMDRDQCTALVPLFGFLLLIYLSNGRSIRPAYRVGAAYALGFQVGVATSIVGLCTSTYGVLTERLASVGPAIVWSCACLNALSLLLFTILLATSFYDKDLLKAPPSSGRIAPTSSGKIIRALLKVRAPWDRQM